MSNLTPYEKRQYLLNKYVKRDYKIEDLSPKFIVYYNPAIDKIKEWKMISVCSTREEALKEILWRKKYIECGDGDLILDNDERFKTFRDETLNVDANGNVYEPGQELMNIDYSAGNTLEVIANSLPVQQSATGFKGMGYYTQFDLNEYKGFYKIEEIYEV